MAKTVFDDVQEGSWYEDYVAAAYDAGIMIGDGNGKFRPDEPLRSQPQHRRPERKDQCHPTCPGG